MDYINYSTAKVKESGGRLTKTKLALLEVLGNLEKPLNPYELADKVSESGGKIDVVTVYRILESLEKLQLVHKLGKGFMPCTSYSCSNSAHCHHLFQCQSCEKSYELHIDDQEFMGKVQEKFGDLVINSHEFVFSGFCKECRS